MNSVWNVGAGSHPMNSMTLSQVRVVALDPNQGFPNTLEAGWHVSNPILFFYFLLLTNFLLCLSSPSYSHQLFLPFQGFLLATR